MQYKIYGKDFKKNYSNTKPLLDVVISIPNCYQGGGFLLKKCYFKYWLPGGVCLCKNTKEFFLSLPKAVNDM